MKQLLLKFIRRFYDETLTYTDVWVKERVTQAVRFFFLILMNGIVGWAFALSLIDIFQVTWLQIGPGAWHILNIFEIGLILWFIESWIRIFWRKK